MPMKELRNEIDQIHEELFNLIERRLRVTKLIWDEKVRTQADFIDQDREKFLLHMHDGKELLKSNPELSEDYRELIAKLIDLNKKYLLSNAVFASQRPNEK